MPSVTTLGGGLQPRHAHGDRAEAADLVLRWHGAAVPRVSLARAAVIHEAEALAFGILEIEPEASVALVDALMGDALRVEALLPPCKRLLAVHPQGRVDDAVGSPPLAPGREIEEGEVGAGRRDAVRIEEVIGAHIVLVDGLLDQPHAERLRVEGVVAGRIGRDGGEVVDTGKLHGASPFLLNGR